MKKLLFVLPFITMAFVFNVKTIQAATPVGFLDLADNNSIAGWAKDDDYNGSIQVHIYVDGQMVQGVLADRYRSDVENHAFHWNHSSFGPGNHTVRAYAIGVNSSGQPDNNNPELNTSPKIISEPEEYSLTFSDGEVKIVLNSKFGGAITQIYDYANMGNLNLINGYQAGAMFQTAFWILPYHSYNPPYGSTDPRFPPDCFNKGYRGDDMTLDNPTQAGFVADGLLGNPIGVFGTSSTPDPDEFIRYENNNTTIHFKNRIIRYDYCQDGGATMDKRQWWDTDFYLEQWASFRSDLPRTLTLKSKITYTGSSPRMVTTRQMPVIFACHLPNTTYWKNGQKISTQADFYGVDPDQNWVALTAANKEVGIGMITSPSMVAMLGRSKFGRETPRIYSECNNDFISTLYPGSGVPDLRTLGILDKVDYLPDHIFTFNPGGSFEWTTYYPIGQLAMIKQNSEAILTDWSNFNMTPPLAGDINYDGHVDISDYNLLVNRFGHPYTIFDYNVLVGNFGK